MDYSQLTIITPTFNEADNVPELIDFISKQFSSASLIVADDGSTDGTQEVITQANLANPKFQLLDRSQADVHGLTISVMDAIAMVETDYFVVIDADLQHPPEVIKNLYTDLLGGNQIVSGARIPYQENQGWHRIFVTRSATFLAKLYLRIFKQIAVSDPMSGFFGGRTEFVQGTIKSSQDRFEPKGYKVFFDLLKASKGSFDYAEIMYQFRFRTSGESKLAPRHAWYFLRSLLR